MVGENTRRSFHLLVGATLTIGTSVIGSFLMSSLTGEQSWWSRLGWLAAGIAVTFFYLRWQFRSHQFLNGDEVSPFGLKTSDFTVFNLADLTPPDPPRRYRLFGGLVFGLVYGLITGLSVTLAFGLMFGLVGGLVFALRTGGWFVLLQEVAHRHLARAGKLPPRPYDFLEWGIERQIFRRIGGGVRFRHNLIQQHLADTSADAGE